MVRIYLKPGDSVQTESRINLVVIEEARSCFSFALKNLDLEDLRIVFDDPESAGAYESEVKFAWDLNPKDEHYGRPYYEKDEKSNNRSSLLQNLTEEFLNE